MYRDRIPTQLYPQRKSQQSGDEEKSEEFSQMVQVGKVEVHALLHCISLQLVKDTLEKESAGKGHKKVCNSISIIYIACWFEK